MNERDLLLLTLKHFGADETVADTIYSDGKLNDKAKSVVENLIKQKSEKIKADLTAKFDSGHQKAKSEVLAKHEADLRKKYSIEDDELSGDNLVAEIIKLQSKVTDESIKTHPEYQKISAELKAISKKAKEFDTVKQELDKVKGQFTKTSLRQKFDAEIAKLNPVISKDATKATKQLNDLFNVISANKVKFSDKGEPIILNENGEPLEDEHGNEITFEALVKAETESRYEFTSSQTKQSAGQYKPNERMDVQTKAGTPIVLTKPKDNDDYYNQRDAIRNNKTLSKEEIDIAESKLLELAEQK